MGIHDELSSCAELKHINGVNVSTSHHRLHGVEDLHQVWCDAFRETSIPSASLVSYNLLTSRQFETSGTRLLNFFLFSISRNGTSNGVKAPSAINQSFGLDKNVIRLKYD